MILVTMGKIKIPFLFFKAISPGSLPKGIRGKNKKIVPTSARITPKIINKRAIVCMPFSRISADQDTRVSGSVYLDILII